ncbi:MAG TPA: hypothetical protein VIA06_17150 [Candidatus Dormibacteraeota bacterium]|jgi:hypothetical protein|nr:hypothetical protein [Candidatus Dormibacteraeota bacterium]
MSKQPGNTVEARRPSGERQAARRKASPVNQAMARAIVADQLLQVDYPERALYWLDQYISRR